MGVKGPLWHTHDTPYLFFPKITYFITSFSLSPNLVCAEAYNPDEEEEDNDPRVRTEAEVLCRVAFPTASLLLSTSASSLMGEDV